MLEPAVTLTDLVLFLLNGFFVVRLLSTRRSVLRTHCVVFFAAIAISSLCGAFAHGFFPGNTPTGVILWRITMLSLGVTSVAAFMIATHLFVPSRGATFAWGAAAAFIAYAIVVCFVRWDFSVALVFYVPSAMFMLAGFLALSARMPQPGWLGSVGLVLTLASAYIQNARLGLHPTWFDHNATYHVVQAAGLLLIFMATKQLLAEASLCVGREEYVRH